MAENPQTCSMPGCNNSSHYAAGGVGGFCRAHYMRKRRWGDASGIQAMRVKHGPECRVDGCAARTKANGYCSLHLDRFYRHGDPLAGGTSPGAPLAWMKRHLSYSGSECLIWPFSRNGNGYGQINYRGRPQLASRVMCVLLYGEAPSDIHEAAHSCGKGHEACVHPGHLRWDTPKGNCADKAMHGTEPRGEQRWNAKLCESDIREIRSLDGKLLHREIARRYGVTRVTVSDVIARRTWAWFE